ncbi:hypothetical protein [Amycolatopsis sp. MtRt-6]|uniref:hypothetical protein n=1 Tax=Amycolatopsis sp. MtRt-6 TaxID=2792782 RepID=UPI001A8C04D3|nr:hypothetical protein [Amycolatopsis sp. MtRt-6]
MSAPGIASTASGIGELAAGPRPLDHLLEGAGDDQLDVLGHLFELAQQAGGDVDADLLDAPGELAHEGGAAGPAAVGAPA